MKVVLFCGGLGTRLREHSDTIPKPLVQIGHRPILWHLMRYYAHHGHKDFILCLGYRGDMIREFFLNYNEALTNDFVMSEGGRKIDLVAEDIKDWRITFVDTGLHSNVGQRLVKVRKYLAGEPVFLANYSDGLSDIPLPKMIDDFRAKKVIASFASVRPGLSFHSVRTSAEGIVEDLGSMQKTDLRINGGFFVLGEKIFEYIKDGEELVEQPFARLVAERQLLGYRHDGFWMPMDTFKDKITYDRMEAQGRCPWMTWKS